MAEVLEELIVKLAGDSEEYKSMLQEAVEELRSTAGEVREAAGAVESFRGSLNDLASTAASAFAAIGLGGGLRDFLNTFGVQEDAIISLRAQVRLAGHDVQSSIERYGEWASAIQRATTYGDEYTLNLLAQAHAYGAVGEAGQRAVEQALALGQVSQRATPETALRITNAVAQGNIRLAMSYGRIVPELRGITSESEFVTRYQRLLAAGNELLTERANTTAGRLQQLSNTWGDLKEVLGEVVAVGIAPIVRWMTLAVDAFHALDPETKEMVSTTIVLTVAVTALGAAIQVVSAALLLLQRRFIILTAVSAVLALLINQFGGIAEVVGAAEDAINDMFGINPADVLGSINGALEAGRDIGQAFTRGLQSGVSGLRGILSGSAEELAAIEAYLAGLGRGSSAPAIMAGAVGDAPGEAPAGSAGLGRIAARPEGMLDWLWDSLRDFSDWILDTTGIDLIGMWNRGVEIAGHAWEEISRVARATWEHWRNGVMLMWNDVTAVATRFWNQIAPGVERMLDSFSRMWGDLLEGDFSAAGEWFFEGLMGLGRLLFWEPTAFLLEDLRGSWDAFWEVIGEYAREAWTAYVRFGQDAWNAVLGIARSVWDAILGFARGMFDRAVEALLSILPSIDIPFLQRGGPVEAGHPYIVGEAGPEWFVPSADGQVIPDARQRGGPVSAGRSYIVGEEGPELFVPSSSGQVVPANSQIIPADVRVVPTRVSHGGTSFTDDTMLKALNQINAHLKAIRTKPSLLIETVDLR